MGEGVHSPGSSSSTHNLKEACKPFSGNMHRIFPEALSQFQTGMGTELYIPTMAYYVMMTTDW